eukprot:11194202-Lingulodinium_polyedra.AAC.1
MAADTVSNQCVQAPCFRKCLEPNSTDPFFYSMALVVPVAIAWPLCGHGLGVAMEWPQCGL